MLDSLFKVLPRHSPTLTTIDQLAGFEEQLKELKAAGATKIYREQVSSVAEREELELLLDYIREGDVVVVTKLDRLARSMVDLMKISSRIADKKASLRILGMNLVTTTATGELIMNVLGSVAQFERSMMLERQAVGIAKAKAEGKYRGRQPTARKKAAQIEELLGLGLGPVDISEKLGISRSSVYRVAEEAIRTRRDERHRIVTSEEA